MKRSISLFKALPYFKVLDEYYGQCLPWLSIRLSEIEMNGEEDDEAIRLTEYVTMEALHDAFTDHNLETERDGFDYVAFMWLICNIYYGDNYHKYMDSDNTDEFGVYAAFDVVKRVSAELLPVLEDYKKSSDKITAEKEKIRKDWEEETKEYWRKRRTELRKEQEAEWGKEEVEGENWKYVQEEIAEVVERHIKDEKEKALSEYEEWKKVVSAEEQLNRVKLNIGGSSVTIDSAAFVLEALFRNHLFPHFLHDIDTVEKANALFVKKAGKKPESGQKGRYRRNGRRLHCRKQRYLRRWRLRYRSCYPYSFHCRR